MGTGVALFFVAGGESDFEFTRGSDGVFKEEFVEVAEAEHEQRARDLLLDGVVLAHQRRCRGFYGHVSAIIIKAKAPAAIMAALNTVFRNRPRNVTSARSGA